MKRENDQGEEGDAAQSNKNPQQPRVQVTPVGPITLDTHTHSLSPPLPLLRANWVAESFYIYRIPKHTASTTP